MNIRNAKVMYGLCILFVVLFIYWIYKYSSAFKEGISIQNGTTMSIQLTGLKSQIDTTNTQLQSMYNTILTLPVSDISPYKAIVEKADAEPLITYQKLNDVITKNLKAMGTQKSDAQLIHTYMSNDPSFKTVGDTNTAIQNTLSTIVGLNVEDNTYTNVLSNTNISPIEKYNQLMVLVSNKTNWG
jgi:preprotein translocase subunit SecF